MLTLKTRKRRFKNSEKGTSLIETIPVLFTMVMIFNFSLGFFGAVHSGILNSIGSYNYALETFRFRSNLVYFRPGSPKPTHYLNSKNRVHGIIREGSDDSMDEDKSKWPATQRALTFSATGPTSTVTRSAGGYAGRDNNNNIWHAISTYAPEESDSIQTPRIWIKTVYGICLNADCGDSN